MPARLGCRAESQLLGETEIKELDDRLAVLRAHQDVLRLHVAVNQPLGVDGVERQEYLDGNVPSSARVPLAEIGIQRHAVEKLHREERPMLVRRPVVVGRDDSCV